jgi:hypothetical protein
MGPPPARAHASSRSVALRPDQAVAAHTAFAACAGPHSVVDLTPSADGDEDDEEAEDYFGDAPVARSFDETSVRLAPRLSLRACSTCVFCQRHSKSPIFPENALQLTLDANYPTPSSPSHSTPYSESLPSTSYTAPLEPVPEGSHDHAAEPATIPARPGVRFHNRVRIASGLRSESYFVRQPSAGGGDGDDSVLLTPGLPPLGRSARERLRRPSGDSLIASSVASSPASSVSVPIRSTESGPPRGSYSQRLLELAQRRDGADLPGTPAPRRKRRIHERTPLVGASSGRPYVPRRRSSASSVDNAELAGLRGGWLNLRVRICPLLATGVPLSASAVVVVEGHRTRELLLCT